MATLFLQEVPETLTAIHFTDLHHALTARDLLKLPGFVVDGEYTSIEAYEEAELRWWLDGFANGPLTRDQLPPHAYVVRAEVVAEGDFRVIVLDVDGDTHAFCVQTICEADTLCEATNAAALNSPGFNARPVFVQIDWDQFLEPDCISLAEALEATLAKPVA